MGFINNAYAAYQNTGIKTASQGKLVVLLYEGAIKNLTNALECFDSDSKIEAKNIEKFGNYIMKAQDIISELQAALTCRLAEKLLRTLCRFTFILTVNLWRQISTRTKKRLNLSSICLINCLLLGFRRQTVNQML